ncbi:MAG: ATP-binding protein [Polyangiaceae bacterium]
MAELRPQTTLFCAVLALAIALSMVLRGRRAVHYLFAAFAADMAFWYASQSFITLFQAPIWVRATGISTVLLPQLATHLFQSIVPTERGSWSSMLSRVAAVLAIPVLLVVLSPYQDAPAALGLIYCYVFGLLAASLVWLERQGRASPSRAVRDRVRFLVAVGALATTFTLADFLSFVGVNLPPIGAVLAIVFLFVLAESLTRPRMADIYEMSGRLAVSTALAFSLAGIFYLFITQVGPFGRMYLNAVLAAIIFMVLFEPLRNQIETRFHQFFFRERYALETSVTDLRKRLAHALEIDEMVETLLAGLERSRRVTSCAIYLADQDGDGYELAGHVGSVAPARVESSAIRPLLDKLGVAPSVYLEDARKLDPSIDTAASVFGALSSSVLLGVRGDTGEVVGIICVADDRVTEAFTPEEIVLLESVASQIGVAILNSRVYARMKERDRLAALGAMAAGLAHEVKNPLGAIKGSAQLLEEITGGVPQVDPSTNEFIGIILEEVNRLDRVVGSFLDYARPHAGNPVPIDINAAVKRTVQILSSQGTDDVVIDLDLAESLPRAKIDPEKLRQVMINLIRNAIQAMDGHGRVALSTARRLSGRASFASLPLSERVSERNLGERNEENELVEIAVRDQGPGISQKVLKNLFVPFFTTKDQGTGLGLAISQSIIQAAGGAINVHPHPGGEGTTFTIVLPAATDAMRDSSPSDAAARTSLPVPGQGPSS